MAEWLSLAGTSGGCLVQSTAQAGLPRADCPEHVQYMKIFSYEPTDIKISTYEPTYSSRHKFLYI